MENTDIKVFELEEYLEIIKILDENDNQLPTETENAELDELQKQFSEDMDPEALKNISEERLINLVKRYRKIVSMVKKKCKYKCQICGHNFLMDNGRYYCEAHHLVPISEDGSQGSENVIILCANHHRMFHYAKNVITLKEDNGEKKIIINDTEYKIEM